MSKGKWIRNGEGDMKEEIKENEIVAHEKKMREQHDKNEKAAEKDWDNSWYEITDNKLRKKVRAKNGNVYSFFCFKIKNDDQKAEVAKLRKQGLVKIIEGMKV